MRKLIALLATLGFIASASAQFFQPPITLVSGTSVVSVLQAFSGAPACSTLAGTATRTLVSKVQQGGFGSTVGAKIRLTFVTTSAASGGTIDSIYAGTGNGTKAWDYGSTPTQITFGGGGTSIVMANSTTYVSDDVPYALDTANPLSIAVDMASGAACKVTAVPITYVSGTSTNTNPLVSSTGCGGAACIISYFKNSIEQAGTVVKAGSYTTTANNVFFLTKIEMVP